MTFFVKLLSWVWGTNVVYIFRYSVNVLCSLLFLSLSFYCDSQVEWKRKLQPESWATAYMGLVVGQLNPAPPGSGWGSGRRSCAVALCWGGSAEQSASVTEVWDENKRRKPSARADFFWCLLRASLRYLSTGLYDIWVSNHVFVFVLASKKLSGIYCLVIVAGLAKF